MTGEKENEEEDLVEEEVQEDLEAVEDLVGAGVQEEVDQAAKQITGLLLKIYHPEHHGRI